MRAHLQHAERLLNDELARRAGRLGRHVVPQAGQRGPRINVTFDVTTKTSEDLTRFLHEIVPGLVAQYLIQAGSVRQCGSISDAFATIAKDRGFDAYVTSRPGHFLNVVRVSDGVFEIDMSAIQFEHDHMAPDPDEEVERLLRVVAEDPYRAMKVRRIREVPEWGQARVAGRRVVLLRAGAVAQGRYPERVGRYMRGEFRKSDRIQHVLEGRPYASAMKPIDLRDVPKINATFKSRAGKRKTPGQIKAERFMAVWWGLREAYGGDGWDDWTDAEIMTALEGWVTDPNYAYGVEKTARDEIDELLEQSFDPRQIRDMRRG